jgi:hypothetical protein
MFDTFLSDTVGLVIDDLLKRGSGMLIFPANASKDGRCPSSWDALTMTFDVWITFLEAQWLTQHLGNVL